jgi:hypothetical protein
MYDDKFEDLIGKTLKSIVVEDDTITFTTSEDERYLMNHCQNCCESVSVESITGELADLLDTPVVRAEESTSFDNPEDVKSDPDDYHTESQTWTFYRISTVKGTVVIRWYGTSNGYYSESVDFEKL